jgi:hypothetical protein
MLGIGWTTFNLVMSGFFIPYKVCEGGTPSAGSCSSTLACPGLQCARMTHAGSDKHLKLSPACNTSMTLCR